MNHNNKNQMRMKTNSTRGKNAQKRHANKAIKGRLSPEQCWSKFKQQSYYTPAGQLYFAIREACCKDKDDVDTLRKLLPSKVCEGQDFQVWPPKHLLLHGLVKQGCVECVRYLLCDLRFSVNQARESDGCTPLHSCFFNLQGHTLDLMADLLVMLGADKSAKNKWGEDCCMFEYKKASLPVVDKFVSGEWKRGQKPSGPASPSLSPKNKNSKKTRAISRAPSSPRVRTRPTSPNSPRIDAAPWHPASPSKSPWVGAQLTPDCVADLDLDRGLIDRSKSFDNELTLGQPARPTTGPISVGKIFTQETVEEMPKPAVDELSKSIQEQEKARQLAEIVWLAASSYGVYNISQQIACWRRPDGGLLPSRSPQNWSDGGNFYSPRGQVQMLALDKIAIA
jgi:hypothetical protein